MASAWIAHVKQYAKTHNITYKDALKQLDQHLKKPTLMTSLVGKTLPQEKLALFVCALW
jgi:hypothetical protein